MYRRTDLETALGIIRDTGQGIRQNFCYCRVSSAKQKDDLERQSSYLGSLYPQYCIIKDVGSGINFSRKGLLAILECAMQKQIGEVVVAYKDRLSRFAFELIETIVRKGGGKITVLDNQQYKSKEDELSEDLLAIVHVFSCRKMGQRRYSSEKSQVEDSSESGAKECAQGVVCDDAVCV
jgi:predicted site-specific integrase-resolvase